MTAIRILYSPFDQHHDMLQRRRLRHGRAKDYTSHGNVDPKGERFAILAWPSPLLKRSKTLCAIGEIIHRRFAQAQKELADSEMLRLSREESG